MNLNNLSYFIDVVQEGSITAAARKNFTTPQAVSDQLRRLEKHYGIPLLIRSTPVSMTPAGELLYQTAKHVLSEVDRLEIKIGQLRTAPSDRLVISTGLSSVPPFLSKVIMDFQARLPDCQVIVMQPPSNVPQLRRPPDDADLLVGNLPFDSDVSFVPLIRDPVCILVSTKLLRSVFGIQWIEIDQNLMAGTNYEALNELPFVYAKGYNWSDHMIGKSCNLPDTGEIPLLLCRDGQCATLHPIHLARSMQITDPELRWYPYPFKDVFFELAIGYRKSDPETPARKALIDAAKAYFRSENPEISG